MGDIIGGNGIHSSFLFLRFPAGFVFTFSSVVASSIPIRRWAPVS